MKDISAVNKNHLIFVVPDRFYCFCSSGKTARFFSPSPEARIYITLGVAGIENVYSFIITGKGRGCQ
jgi:hypothetical protein